MSPRPTLPLRMEYILLGLIRQHPSYGYKLLQYWNGPSGIKVLWHIKPGQFYLALEKLEQLGLIAMLLVPGDAAPTRKEYHITPSGEQAFLNWMSTPVSAVRDFRQDFLAKLFFSNEVNPTQIDALIDLQKAISRAWLSNLQKNIDDARGFDLQVQSFRLRQVQAILNWLDELSLTR